MGGVDGGAAAEGTDSPLFGIRPESNPFGRDGWALLTARACAVGGGGGLECRLVTLVSRLLY